VVRVKAAQLQCPGQTKGTEGQWGRWAMHQGTEGRKGVYCDGFSEGGGGVETGGDLRCSKASKRGRVMRGRQRHAWTWTASEEGSTRWLHVPNIGERGRKGGWGPAGQ
jgi:hypothetical protein